MGGNDRIYEVWIVTSPANKSVRSGFGMLDEEDIRTILDKYGLETILQDAGLKEWEVLEVLHDRGFIDLEVYLDE